MQKAPTINQKYSFESLEQKLIYFTNFCISSSLGLDIEEVSTQFKNSYRAITQRFKEIWREVLKQHLRRWKPAGGIA